MMYLKNIKVNNFKNIAETQWEFSSKINAFVGENGKGKTNMLDVIHYLSFGKSFLNFQDSQNIRFGEDFFYIEGTFLKEEQDSLVQLSLKKGQLKNIKFNYKNYDRISDHVGKFPLVVISPYDRDLITEGSETRRKFLDSMIAQTSSLYMQDLLTYQKALNQRNALLKYFSANQVFHKNQLDLYDHILVERGQKIYEKRKSFIELYDKGFKQIYKALGGLDEFVSVDYQSELSHTDFSTLLAQKVSIDTTTGYTSSGIHKDDLVFLINEHPIKKYGSQGQQKTFLISLKLAQLGIINEELHLAPILLLDDIFDKLDDMRVEKLVKMVNGGLVEGNGISFGQIFLTDTHVGRTEETLKKVNNEYKIFEIK